MKAKITVCFVMLVCSACSTTSSMKDGRDSGLKDPQSAPASESEAGHGGSGLEATGGGSVASTQDASAGGSHASDGPQAPVDVKGAKWTGVIPCSSSPSFWPNDAKGAVSLTYDDALTSPLRHALPALDAKGFKATFFLTTGKSWNPDLWKPLVSSGHELASHSVTHNSTITTVAMDKEIVASLETIRALGVIQPAFSFAYPNGQTSGPDGSYIPAVKQHTLAARGLNGASQRLGVAVEFGNIPSRILGANDNLPSIINETLAQHSWTTFVVHGIEDDLYLNIPKAKHDELVDLLASKGREVWVAPFITVADYLKRCQK